MLRPPRRYAHFLFAAIQSALTSSIAAAIASFNLIWVGGFLRHWLQSWTVAWIVMLPVVIAAAPVILRLSEFMTRPDRARSVVIKRSDCRSSASGNVEGDGGERFHGTSQRCVSSRAWADKSSWNDVAGSLLSRGTVFSRPDSSDVPLSAPFLCRARPRQQPERSAS
jgi:hypothetical protein